MAIMRFPTSRVLPLALPLVLAACNAEPAGSSPVATPTGPASVVASGSAAATSSTASSPLGGAVIHVDLRVPIASAADLGGKCDSASFGAHTAAGTPLSTIPGATFTLAVLRGPRLAAITVPASGTIVPRGGDDPLFRTDCSFTFDVPADSTSTAYVFAVGRIYFPVPIMPRDQLEATGWIATIGVNVDQ